MDRIFVLQKAYVNDKYNPDGLMLLHLIEQYHRRTMDKFIVTNDTKTIRKRFEKEIAGGWKIIPVGTLEFVHTCMKALLEKDDFYMKPIEVPETLRDYRFTRRLYAIMKGRYICRDIRENSKEWFIKDADHLKSWNNLLMDGDCSEHIESDVHYVVSERVSLLSEYRVFVCKKDIVGIYNYSGDPCIFPEESALLQMMFMYSTEPHPDSYVMDLGIAECEDYERKTVILEVHPFTSCGLYGMYDRCLLDMLEDGINWYVQQNQKKKGEK